MRPLRSLLWAAALGSAPSLLAASFISNPSFEKNYNPTFPHYGPVTDWSGASGVNRSNGPFHNNGTPIPDQTQVAFMQGSGSLKQQVSGLTPGETYWIQFFYDARACCGGTIDLATKFGGADLDRIVNLKPVTGGRSYEFRNVPFVPQADSGELSFVTTAAGDATALLDAITIVQRGTNDIAVMNPSFEASGEIAEAGAIASPQRLAGWTIAQDSIVGINLAGAGYANNGSVPDQASVAYIEGVGGISQLIRNLQAGTEYNLSLAVNAPDGGSPNLQVSVDGQVLLNEAVSAVGGDASYAVKTVKFKPSGPTAEISIQQSADAQVLLVDDVRIQGVVIIPLDPIRFSPSSAELAPGQTAQISVSVDPRLLENAPARLVVRIGNQNVATIAGADPDGSLALNLPKGGSPTATFTVQARSRGVVRIDLTENADQQVANDATINVVTSHVRNPSFEENAAGAFPGYGSIVAWNSPGGTGLNKREGPFHNGDTAIPDRLQAAFMQGSTRLNQQISGLQPGRTYWLQFAYDVRDCCGGTIDLAVSLAGKELSKITGVAPFAENRYHSHSVSFVAEGFGGLLEFATTAQGDATVTLDAVSIVERSADEVVVLNPSFESEGTPSGVGYIQPSRIFGWNAVGGYGVNIIGVGPFTDNGSGTEQDRVLLLQGNGSSVSQTIHDLTPGEVYTLLAQINARNCCGPEATFYEISVGGELLAQGEMRPVGGQNRYRYARAVFVPTEGSTEIRIKHTSPTGDHTLLVDNVRVLKGDVPAPVSLATTDQQDGTIRITWPVADTEGMILQSAPTPEGPWTNVTSPVSQDGDNNVVVESSATGTVFYRLAK